MKNRTKVFYSNVALLLLVLLLAGCSGGKGDESKTNSSAKDSAIQSEKETENTDEGNKKEDESTSLMDDSEESSSRETGSETSHQTSDNDNDEDNPLSDYSSEEIEYARVWLQLGDIKDVDELNVRHIPAGTALNSDDETSADYPEDVIQLAGGRLVAGSVTYSGNGDGTINKYNVPLRWDSKNPAGKNVYQDIIENTQQVSIDPGDDDEIIELMSKMNIH